MLGYAYAFSDFIWAPHVDNGKIFTFIIKPDEIKETIKGAEK